MAGATTLSKTTLSIVTFRITIVWTKAIHVMAALLCWLRYGEYCYAECLICCVSPGNPLSWVFLCWVSLWGVSSCWVSLFWVSLCCVLMLAEYPYSECPYAECPYAECPYAKCRYAECHDTEYHYTECHYTECHDAECHYAECDGAIWLLCNLSCFFQYQCYETSYYQIHTFCNTDRNTILTNRN